MLGSRSPQISASVRALQIYDRSKGNNAGGIDVIVREIVVALDVIEVHRFGDPGLLIEVPQVGIEIQIIHDASHVALEMAMIHRVESYEATKKPPIGFDDAISEKITLRSKARLQFIERGK